jgi:hypothetical protein
LCGIIDDKITSALLLQESLASTVNPLKQFSDVAVGALNDLPVCFRHQNALAQGFLLAEKFESRLKV